MSHANIAMTMRYAHLSPRHEAEAVAKLNAKLEQNRNVLKPKIHKLLKLKGNLLRAVFM
jgi:hypothetical protein